MTQIEATAQGESAGEIGLQALKSQRTRQAILDAARHLASTEGISRLTLARVAEHAGLSKGGLLHHFASKQALIVDLLNDTLDDADTQLRELAETNTRDRGAFAQAYLDFVRTGQHTNGTAAGIFAAAAIDGGDLGPARAMFESWQEQLVADDGLDEATALLARVVGDGLWLIDLFGLAPPSTRQREALFALIEHRFDGAH